MIRSSAFGLRSHYYWDSKKTSLPGSFHLVQIQFKDYGTYTYNSEELIQFAKSIKLSLKCKGKCSEHLDRPTNNLILTPKNKGTKLIDCAVEAERHDSFLTLPDLCVNSYVKNFVVEIKGKMRHPVTKRNKTKLMCTLSTTFMCKYVWV